MMENGSYYSILVLVGNEGDYAGFPNYQDCKSLPLSPGSTRRQKQSLDYFPLLLLLILAMVFGP